MGALLHILHCGTGTPGYSFGCYRQDTVGICSCRPAREPQTFVPLIHCPIKHTHLFCKHFCISMYSVRYFCTFAILLRLLNILVFSHYCSHVSGKQLLFMNQALRRCFCLWVNALRTPTFPVHKDWLILLRVDSPMKMGLPDFVQEFNLCPTENRFMYRKTSLCTEPVHLGTEVKVATSCMCVFF